MNAKSFFYLLIILIQSYLSLSFLQKENTPPRNLQELSDDIIILHTNDVHCGITDYIGYDGLMLYKNELRKKYKHIITVDVGDHIQGGTIGLISKGEDIITIMNKIEYDVAILGNHEFDYGVDQLEVCKNKLSCGYICANYCLRKTKQPIYDPYKIIEKGDKKIAFIGVATPQTITRTFLHEILDENNNTYYDFLMENNGKELYEKIQGYINEVKSKGADYVIILAHLGNGGDAQYEFTSDGLLANLEGVDAMLDGHTHLVYNQTSKDKNGKNIPLAQTGTKLANIGVLKIATNGEITSELINKVPQPEDETNAFNTSRGWVDKEMNEMLEAIIDSHSEELNEVIGTVSFDMIINSEPGGSSKTQISRSQEVSLGDLVADAIRDIGKGDICLINAGSIRTDLFEGNITYGDILDVLPFSADIVVKEVPGSVILDALEMGVMFLPSKSSIFPQVSGISYKVDTSFNSSVELDASGKFLGVNGERRIYNVKVGNETLDANKKYRMSFDNYIAGGGDGFDMFSKYEEIESTSNTDNQALITYIKDALNGTIPERYKESQNRIVIEEKKEEEIEKMVDNGYILGYKFVLTVILLLEVLI